MDDMVGVRLGVPRPVLQDEENLCWVRVGQVSASSRYYSTFNEMTDINKLEMSIKKKKGWDNHGPKWPNTTVCQNW